MCSRSRTTGAASLLSLRPCFLHPSAQRGYPSGDARIFAEANCLPDFPATNEVLPDGVCKFPVPMRREFPSLNGSIPRDSMACRALRRLGNAEIPALFPVSREFPNQRRVRSRLRPPPPKILIFQDICLGPGCGRPWPSTLCVRQVQSFSERRLQNLSLPPHSVIARSSSRHAEIGYSVGKLLSATIGCPHWPPISSAARLI